MPPPSPSSLTIPHAYRTLYRTALTAVHYSTPARYQIRDLLRHSFRTEPAHNFKVDRVHNTIRFLQRARESNGTEHKILRGILHAHYWGNGHHDPEKSPMWVRGNDEAARTLRSRRYDGLHATVVLLNESLGLCLRS